MSSADPLSISGIYLIRCNPSGKVYVGSSVNVAKRWRTHKMQLRKGVHHSDHLQRAWKKYGDDAFSFEVIEETHPNELLISEQKHINELGASDPDRGFNMAPIAGNTLGIKLPPFSQQHRDKIGSALKGRKLSPEQCAAMSARRKGKPSAMKGKKLNLSAESRLAMSVAKKGKKLSAEHIAKGVAARTGLKRSAEACANMSKARTGVPATERQMVSILAVGKARRKFTDQQVVEIRNRIEINQRVADIAAEFCCNQNTIYRIKNNERRSYL